VRVCFVFFLRWRCFFSASVAFSGFLLTGGSILLQSSQYLLRLPFGTSAAIQPGAEARDNGDEIAHQVVVCRIGRVEDDQFPLLHGKPCLDVGDPEPGGPILMLDHNPANLLVSKHRQKLGALIVDATADLFDHLADRPALRVAPAHQPPSLRIQVLLVLA